MALSIVKLITQYPLSQINFFKKIKIIKSCVENHFITKEKIIETIVII